MRLDVERIAGAPAFGLATHAAVADLNGDGWLDVAASVSQQGQGNNNSGYISVSMNLGEGVFGEPAPYGAGLEPCCVGAMDFGHDGPIDLAVCNAADNAVSILSGRGDGRFGAPVNYGVGSQPRSLLVADLNGDGFADLAVLNCLSNDVSILINRGDGGFSPESRVLVGGVTQRGDPNLTFPYPGPFMTLGDFNRDGAPDLAVPAINRVKVLINSGGGAFTLSPVSFPAGGGGAYCLVASDLNRDGRLDLAVALSASGVQTPVGSVLMGLGDGSFGPPAVYDVNPFSPGSFIFTNSVDAGDLDGDGYPELVFGHEISHSRATLLRNRGDGTFFPKEFVNCGSPSWFVALRDVRNRGKPDLVTLDAKQRSALKVVLNDGTGQLLSTTRSPPILMTAGDVFHGGAAADLDHDGIMDLVVTVVDRPHQLKLFRGRGGGRFEPVSTVSVDPQNMASGNGVVLADLNGDGWADIAFADPIVTGGFSAPGRIWVLLNTREFSFGPPVSYPLDGVFPVDIGAIDLNGDGRLDLAAWSQEVYPGSSTVVERRMQVLINRGGGLFDPPVQYWLGDAPWGASGGLAMADLDHDGRPDLIGAVRALAQPGMVVTLHNRGDGTFEPWATVLVRERSQGLAAADFNGDGAPDVAVLYCHACGPAPPIEEPYLTILFNDGSGGFPTRVEYTDPNLQTGVHMTAADLNGDGHLDLAFTDSAMLATVVMLNRGDGTLGAPVGYGVGALSDGVPWQPLAGDFDGNGRTDLVTVIVGSFVSFLPNLLCPGCYANCDGSVTPPVLNGADFVCFMNRFASRDPRANCDTSLTAWGAPALDVGDFVCFLQRFAAGCQ